MGVGRIKGSGACSPASSQAETVLPIVLLAPPFPQALSPECLV